MPTKRKQMQHARESVASTSHRLHHLLGVLLCGAAAISLSCGSKPQQSRPIGPAPDGLVDEPSEGDDGLVLALEDAPDGLNIQISEGKGSAGRVIAVKQAAATKLSAADANGLLSRLPALVGKTDDRKNFALREKSLPPPRTGKTINDKFPGKAGGPPPTSTNSRNLALKVIRHAPEGELPLVPHLSVTFNQPMIAVTSHADTTAVGVPVKLTPTPAGKWRWVGTKTLLFDPDVRFPAATEYQVEIAAGTKSTSGKALADKFSFKFGTPAVRLLASYPQNGPHKLDPLMFARFDQKISAKAVLDKIRVEAGKRRYRVRAASAEEIKKDAQMAAMVAAAEGAEQDGRFVVFRVGEDLPKNSNIAVTIEKGTPSAEGPRTTKSNQSFSFRTFGPLRVVRSYCSWGRNCPPRTPWGIELSNPLDADDFEPADIIAEPKLARMRPNANNSWISIENDSKGRTNYTVTLPASLKDQFGQTLGKPTKVYFNVGKADPALMGSSGLVVLDPAARKQTFDVFTTNVSSLNVSIHKVEPKHWNAFLSYMQQNPRQPKYPPGKQVVRKKIKPRAEVDGLVETQIDLSKALDAGLGHAVITVEPTNWPQKRWKPKLYAWVQSTQIGLDAFVDSGELVGWATELRSGKPISGAKLEIAPFGIKGTTDAKGISRLNLSSKVIKNKANLLLARRGKDVAFLPENTYYWGGSGGWVKRAAGKSLSWFTFDDRSMYRPGETVSVKGWIRSIDNGEGGDITALRGAISRIKYKVIGPRGNEIAKGQSSVSPLGGFDLKAKLPKTPNLGYASIQMQAVGKFSSSGAQTSHRFQIQEFRRPEYEVTAVASQGPHMVGRGADVTVNADYFAGGGLANADVQWNVRSTPGSFTPPNRADFTFGRWVPWWVYHSPNYKLQKFQQFQGKTNASGKHSIRLDFLSSKPPRPMSVTAEAYVTDVNRQRWAAQTNLLVHPSEYYVGLKRARYFVEQGEPIKVDAIVVDHDGKSVLGRKAKLRAVRLDWKYKAGKWTEEESDEQTCEVTAAADAQKCEFKTPEGGTYRIVGHVEDNRGRPNETEVMVWVSGGKRPPERKVTLEALTLVPDKKDYKPGDTAKILVQSPFYPAEGLLTTRRSGIVDTTRFKLTGPTTTVKIPIVEGHVPNLHVNFDVVGAAERLSDKGEPNPKLPRRPAFAAGTLKLSVPPVNRTLVVEVEPTVKKLAPGKTTWVRVGVTDHRGRPVPGAELAAIVVDESVLALSGKKTPDPVAAFYAERYPGARDYHARSYVKLARPETSGLVDNQPNQDPNDAMADEAEATGGAAPPSPVATKSAPKEEKAKDASKRLRAAGNKNGGQTAPQPIAVRKNFDALATFAPKVITDKGGRARVKVELPDNLTRYRVMIVAVAGDRQFGSGESSITARMPLMVRPSAPRFLNFGDTFEFPVVLQNQTDEAMQVKVAMRTTNAALTDGNGRMLTIPANDRVEVRFPAAAQLPGIARFQVGAQSGKFADATELAMPVWTPATTEAFATYGEIDKGAIRQPVSMPTGVVKEFGGIEVTTSSTQLQALTDAFVYLVGYPYECSEQTSSRILAIAALRDVLGAFKADGLPGPAEINRIIERDIKQLKSLQNYDGGFAFWARGYESWPYNSIHAAHALVRAKDKGYAVPANMLASSKRYLQNIKKHIPWYYSKEAKWTLRAYALYVRKRMKDRDTAKAKALLKEAGLKRMPMDGVGWLLGAMTGDARAKSEITSIHRHLDNRVTETAGAAHWATSMSDGAHLILHSDRRADGVILESLIDDKPKSDLIPKVVRGLLAHRVRGRWGNTQENSFVLLAMDRYFRAFEKVTPNFVSKIWLGNQMAPEQRFKGRETKRHHVDIPMMHLAKAKKTDLTIAKEGKGRLYYRIGMNYAPSSLWLPPADHGFAVERTYEAVDDPADVTRMKNGTWKIKAGAEVRVRLTMVAEARRYHVALVDKLPAGLEPSNPALAVTGTISQDPKSNKGKAYWWWYRTWYEHQNMRDERVEAFTSLLWAGAHEYTYVARATTPGSFIVPPAKAEEMYSPETFGRSSSAKVIIE